MSDLTLNMSPLEWFEFMNEIRREVDEACESVAKEGTWITRR